MPSVEEALEELYQASPADFVGARKSIADRLAKAGDDAAAATVRARRKPTQIAWVLNQLSRQRPDDIAELVDVGRELAREQRRALRGETSASLRESIARQREVVSRVARSAGELMRELGVDTSHLDEVTSALGAALVDPVIGAELEAGRLEKPPAAAVGFVGPIATGREETAPARPGGGRKKEPRPARAARRPSVDRRGKAKAEALAERRARAAEARERKAATVRAKAEARERKQAIVEAEKVFRAAEAEAARRRRAAEKAEETARAAAEEAARLTKEADASERRVDDARKILAQIEG